MAVERRAEADWGNWPGRSTRPKRRERLERTLFSATGNGDGDRHTTEPSAEPAPARGSHLLFVWSTQGYGLVEGYGELPEVGDIVNVGGEEYVAAKLGRSPLPDDDRPCAFLEPLR